VNLEPETGDNANRALVKINAILHQMHPSGPATGPFPILAPQHGDTATVSLIKINAILKQMLDAGVTP
jgi:hypothetical protein